jgi:hypothetical protein
LNKAFEDALVRFCAPVLLGKKPAALFPKPGRWEADFFHSEIIPLKFLTLPRPGQNPLIFVYRTDLLKDTLKNPEAGRALENLGYPVYGDRRSVFAADSVEGCLRHLTERFISNWEFPHEVGFFLGYPPPDVLGFMRHRGEHCKLCGYWKVYSDVEKASALFREYESCKQRLLEYIEKGGGITCIMQESLYD